MKDSRAFTLIELLVVVLIIGILAAVAVSQYKATVLKSRLATMQSNVKTLVQAAEVYYLANAYYTDELDMLDVGEIDNCEDKGSGNLLCGKMRYQIFVNASGSAHVNGWVLSKEGIEDSYRVIGYRVYLSHSTVNVNKKECVAFTETAHQVCKSIGGKLLAGTASYSLP